MRLPADAHTAQPWRIHAIAAGFRVEDVWALPTPGGKDDFPRLVELTRPRAMPVGVYPAMLRALGRAWDDQRGRTPA
jgi:hypothetical protein